MKGDAFTFVSPDEENDLRDIERAIGRRLPRVTVPDFDYKAKPEGKLEVPLAERLAKHRALKAGDRKRAAENAKRRGGSGGGGSSSGGPGGGGRRR
jgi:ATP-dependent RNA helicase RhlE